METNKRKKQVDPRIKDPTMRQEFPGADTSKKKIEAGVRNIKNKQTEPGKHEPDTPAKTEEPLEERSKTI